jgi:hypothetical protein
MLPLQVLTCCTYSQPIAKAWLTTPAHVHSVIKFVGFNHGMAIPIYCKSTQLSNIRPGYRGHMYSMRHPSQDAPFIISTLM